VNKISELLESLPKFYYFSILAHIAVFLLILFFFPSTAFTTLRVSQVEIQSSFIKSTAPVKNISPKNTEYVKKRDGVKFQRKPLKQKKGRSTFTQKKRPSHYFKEEKKFLRGSKVKIQESGFRGTAKGEDQETLYRDREQIPSVPSISGKMKGPIPKSSSLIDWGDDIKRKLIFETKLSIPDSLKGKGIRGDMIIKITVDKAGRVISVLVIKSSGYSELDIAAKKVVNKYRFNKIDIDKTSHGKIKFIFSPNF